MTSHSEVPSKDKVTLPPSVVKPLTMTLGALGAAGLVLGGIGYAGNSSQFFHSYLVAYMFCLSLSLGAMFFTLIQHVVGAVWSVVVRRLAELVMANFGVLLILAIPILIGQHDLFHWMDHNAVEHDELLKIKEPYLNPTFFYIRLVIYFGIWFLISSYFFKGSTEVDDNGSPDIIRKLRRYAAPALPVYALTQTFASFDLLMSLDPHWFSTMYGVYFFAGCTVTSFALLTVLSLIFQSKGYLRGVVTDEHLHDLGKLMFAFTIFYAYIAFCQYFLIWYGNLPEETMYYLHRWEGGWKPVSLLIVFGRFVIPFIILLSRHPKRMPFVLGAMAVWIIFMQYVDLYWSVMPELHHEGLAIHWLDIACFLGVFGVYGAVIARRFGRYPLVPIQDPLLRRSLEFENA